MRKDWPLCSTHPTRIGRLSGMAPAHLASEIPDHPESLSHGSKNHLDIKPPSQQYPSRRNEERTCSRHARLVTLAPSSGWHRITCLQPVRRLGRKREIPPASK